MSSPLRNNLLGFSLNEDRLWTIEPPGGVVAVLTEYNDELTGYSHDLIPLFDGQIISYGGNAYYILNEARKRGYVVLEVEDRR